ncbi:TPA: Rha family transcriptional regulator [Escherichia coli]|uniref:Regulatory protein n=1 Tax=Siphoviridae sp. ct5lU19 TaxID=2827780 RepID=A0A8S5SBF3_9CAUD|nr:MAG TPA: regulatory protein [Siphoviridae sp. ct5lU19]
MRANPMKKNLTENLSCQGINPQFDSLFFNFEPLFQVFEFFGESNVLIRNSILSNQSGCQFSIGVFWIINIDDFSIFSGNNGNTVLAHRAHFTSNASAFYFEVTALIADGYIVKTITAAAVSQKLVDHVVSPYFFVAVNAHPNLIIDHALFQVYTVSAAAKSVAGIGVLELIKEHNRALAVFLCEMHCYTLIMVGRAGASKDAPASLVTGYANPARLTTNEIGVSCGELLKLTKEAAIMATIPTLVQPEISVINGQAVTSSLAIADFFTKRHDDVLKKIRALECSLEFTARNFAVSEYTDATGRKLPCYQITRDGFAFLAMGFTGKRAAQFKEAYITAFNRMENALHGASDNFCAAHNAHVVYLYMSEIHRVWLEQLYPMLVSVQSPLASSLYDYINDGVFVAGLVDSELNKKHKEVRK